MKEKHEGWGRKSDISANKKAQRSYFLFFNVHPEQSEMRDKSIVAVTSIKKMYKL